MFHSASVAIMSTEDTATTYLAGTGHDIPTIAFGDGGNAFEVSLNSLSMPLADQAAWLRAFAGQVLDLADQIEPHGGALVTQHMTEAQVRAGVEVAG